LRNPDKTVSTLALSVLITFWRQLIRVSLAMKV
jgi:hypothetical protein